MSTLSKCIIFKYNFIQPCSAYFAAGLEKRIIIIYVVAVDGYTLLHFCKVFACQDLYNLSGYGIGLLASGFKLLPNCLA